MKALFAVSSLWLWHATRTSVVINHFLEKWFSVDVVSFWNALNFLKSEIKSEKVNFIEMEDYPALERWTWMKFYYYLICDLVKTKKLIKKEKSYTEKIAKNYDFIFSDWKYWFFSKKIPSFLLSHQLSFIMPKWLNLCSKISDYFNCKYFQNFDMVFIPDYEDEKNSLAWKLSHPNWINKINYKYIWILSSFYDCEKKDSEKIDYLFTISWYLNEHKDDFINKLLQEAKKLKWKKIFVLWDTKNDYKKELENDITIYSFVSWEKRKELFLNAENIISRAWYTTIMDLVELWRKAIMFPTPNQTEQEYLAEFLESKKIFSFWENPENLVELEKNINENISFDNFSKTSINLKEIDEIIHKFI